MKLRKDIIELQVLSLCSHQAVSCESPQGAGSPPALRVGVAGGLARNGCTKPRQPHPACSLRGDRPDTVPAFVTLCLGRCWGGGGSRVFGDNSGERTNSFVELLRSKWSLRGAKTQKHGEGTGGLDENLKHLSLA